MAVFDYKALADTGRVSTGIIDADSIKAARGKLRAKGLFPTALNEQVGRGSKAKKGSKAKVGKHVRARVPLQEVAAMTRQLSTLFAAGIPMVEALGALVDQVESGPLKVVISSVKEKVNEGASLANSMRGYPRVFSDLYVNMIAAGEASGALEVVLGRLANFLEDQIELRNKIVGTMAYPVIMSTVGGGVVIFLVTFIIPMFEKMFAQMKVPLPFITRFMIATSGFIGTWWILLILGGIGMFFGFFHWMKSPKGRIKWDRFVLQVPLAGRTIRMIAIGRFTRTLATLLASGVNLIQALKIVEAIVGNSTLAKAIENTRKAVQEGASIAEPLKRSGQFPGLVTHMIATGEKTGELEGMLEKVSDSVESQVKNRIDLMTSVLEPVMILGMAIMVGIIAVSILLPMMRMYSMVKS